MSKLGENGEPTARALQNSTNTLTEELIDGEDKAEIKERGTSPSGEHEPSSKRPKLLDSRDNVAQVKQEFLIPLEELREREGSDARKPRGQNKARKFVSIREENQLCPSVAHGNACTYGGTCKFEHDVNRYLENKKPDVGSTCPVWEATGSCTFRCRFAAGHIKEGKLVVNEEKEKLSVKDLNKVSKEDQILLRKRQIDTPRAKLYEQYLQNSKVSESETAPQSDSKRKMDFKGKRILAPLTTVGNVPFRRLCRDLGAEVTYSEMAVSLPLLQGQRSEWALPRAHADESIFGVQISAAKPLHAIQSTEVLSKFCSKLDFVDLNCGCPIDLIYKNGAGSALLDNPGKLIKMVKGMSYVAGSTPITAKLRLGVKDNHPSAQKLIRRLILETDIAAITLHGRSRQQRYTRSADWKYIAKCASMVKELNEETGRQVNFIGNGDCYSWQEYYHEVEELGVDSVMVARGALIKPWIFEEIEKKQDIDKSASERLDMVRSFANYGLEHWGSDDFGINQTRRYLCEFLSFSYRYVPVGILEHLPSRLQDRAPRWRGRNDMETLLGSADSQDWVRVSEMFLGPAPDEWKFTPKHKSNASEGMEAEG